MIRRFALLHLRPLRRRPGRVAAAGIAVAAAACLLGTIESISGSLTGSVADIATIAGRASVEVSALADDGLTPGLADSIAGRDGVAAVVPMVRSPVAAAGRPALLFGLDARAEKLEGLLGTELRAREADVGRRPDEYLRGVVIGPGLARATGLREGMTTSIYSGRGGSAQAPVLAVVDANALGRLNDGMFVVALLPLAERLAGHPGRPDLVYAIGRDATDPAGLQRSLTDLAGNSTLVSSPQLRTMQAEAQVAAFRRVLIFVALLALAVAGFLTYDVITMLALERRRELATMRALGGRRVPLLIGFIAPAAGLGLVASAIGAGAGLLVASAVLGSLPQLLVSSLGARLTFHLTPTAIAAPIVAGVVASLLAALMPGLKVVAAQPIEAMRQWGSLETAADEVRLRPVPAALGATAVAAGLWILFVVGQDRVPAGTVTGLIIGGTVLTMFGLMGPISATTAMVTGVLGAPGRLAAESIRRAPRRAWLTATAVALAVTLAVAIEGVSANAVTTADTLFAPLAGMGAVVQTSPLDGIPTAAAMPDSWKDQLATSPGVKRVIADRFRFITLGQDRVLVMGLGGGTHDPIVALSPTPDQGGVAAGRGAIVTREFARQQRVSTGSVLTIPSAGGPRRIPVLAISDAVSSPGQGEMAISAGLFSTWFQSPGAGRYEIELQPGASASDVIRRAGELASSISLPVSTGTGTELLAARKGLVEQITSIFQAIKWVALASAALAVVNSLNIAVAERRREIGILRALGARRRQVRLMVLAEVGAVAAVGAAIGLACGSVLHYAGVVTFTHLIGFPIVYQPVWPALALILGLAVVAALLGGIVPAEVASRTEIVEAVGYE